MMTQQALEIKILRQHWIKDDGKNDREDICSHGELFIRFGSKILSNTEDGAWALNVCGLFLMRSLGKDCGIDEFENYMAPCCGHFWVPNDENNFVTIQGCNMGIDWKTEHLKNDVKLTSEKGDSCEIPFDEYRNIVAKFINEVEDFYGDPKLKVIPNDKFDQDGFNQFWAEWNSLKLKWSI